MTGKVLIIDDEEKLRSLIARLLKLEGLDVIEAATLKAASKLMEVDEPDVVLCDVKLPDGNGVDFIPELKSRFPHIEVILLTAFGNLADGIQAMKNGAFDYLLKGDDNNKIIPLLNNALDKVALQKRLLQLESLVGKKYSFDTILGNSAAIQKAKAMAMKVAQTDATVLLLGETGTGKEVFAQAIHQANARSRKAFIALNCGAFSNEILASELFGHKAGAFTGALKDKKGLLEEANGGTIFLDEIGEMPVDLQAKLLRVLENGEYFKVGDTKLQKADVRVIAATNRDLKIQIENHEFREDLFYRLNVFSIHIPNLQERKEDIPELSSYFLQVFSAKFNRKIKSISPAALKLLSHHNWKGNIRELKNVIERSVIIEESNTLTPQSLSYDIQTAGMNESDNLSLAAMEKRHIQKLLALTNGNKTEAARILDIGLTTLYRKMEEYNLPK